MISLEYLAFAQIITVLHENFQKLFETGNGGGGGRGRLAPPARTPMLFSYGHPSRTCKPGLTQAFLQVAQQAISLIKPLLHFEAFRWNLCAAALWNKFQQALQPCNMVGFVKIFWTSVSASIT